MKYLAKTLETAQGLIMQANICQQRGEQAESLQNARQAMAKLGRVYRLWSAGRLGEATLRGMGQKGENADPRLISFRIFDIWTRRPLCNNNTPMEEKLYFLSLVMQLLAVWDSSPDNPTGRRAPHRILESLGEIGLLPECLLLVLEALTHFRRDLEACGLIEHVQCRYPGIVEGYPRIASKVFWSQHRFERAASLLARDYESGLLTPRYQIEYAKAVAVCGDMDRATKIVELAYSRENSLANGYAGLAWMGYVMREYYPEKAIHGFQKDKDLGKLKGAMALNHAYVCAGLGCFREALSMVDAAYRESKSFAGGRPVAAWYYHVARNHEHEPAIPYFQEQYETKNISPQSKILFAGLLCFQGDLRQAEFLVDEAYRESADAIGGNFLIGVLYWLKRREFDVAHNYFQKDVKLQRTRPFLKLCYAIFLANFQKKHGHSLTRLLRESLFISQSSWPYCFSWLLRIGFPRKTVEQLMSHKILKRCLSYNHA